MAIHSPGFDFATMADLTFHNGSQSLTDHLLLAIFWEETLFNNIKQPNGAALGFGQVEPAELRNKNATGEISVDISRILLDPAASVDASGQMLDALVSKLGKIGALRGYAGVNYKPDPSWRAARLGIIDRWLHCEMALLNIDSDIQNVSDDPDRAVAALQKAKIFAPDSPTDKGMSWREALFPSD